MKIAALFLVLFSISGCYSPITHIGGLEKDEFLRTHLTPEAYEAAKDIPIVQSSFVHGGLAAGTNFWSNVASFFIGCGVGRKIIMSEEFLGDNAQENITHELIHHFHDMTLDGDSWIDEEEFISAYKKCSTDRTYAGVVIMTEAAANQPITNIFGISDLAEYIAYSGARAHIQKGPTYLEAVFRKFLKPLR